MRAVTINCELNLPRLSIETRDSTEIIYIRYQLDSYLQALPTFSKEKRAKEELGKASFSRASE